MNKSVRFLSALVLLALFALVVACSTPVPTVAPTQPAKATEVPKPTEAPTQAAKAPEPTKPAAVPVTAAPATQPTKAAVSPKRGGTLTILNIEEVKGLFNHQDSGTEGEYVLNQITDGLVNADIDMNIVPGLAESWEMSPDGLTYTFKLRKGVKFHDGSDFDAEDVKWTFDQAIIPGSYMGAKWAPYIKTTNIIDQYTVKITLVEPWYDFMTMLAFEEDLDILAPEVVKKWGNDYGFKAAVGTGPFKFDHWNRGEELVLVRNENYWGAGDQKLPYLDKIVYRAVLEDSVKVMQLRTKAADMIFNFAFTEVTNAKKDPNLVVETMAGGTQHYLALLPDKPPFNDLTTRQAMCYGIDRQSIVDTIFAGQATVANGIFPPQLFVAENDKVYFPYDPAKAKDLLTKAGYSDAKPLKFYLLTSNASLYTDMAVLVQAQLKKIGAQAEIVPLEKAALSTYTAGTAPDSATKRQSVLYRRGLSGLIMNDYTLRGYLSTGGANSFGYNQKGGIQNPEVEKLILGTYQLVDKAKLIENNRKLNELISKDCSKVLIAYQNNVVAYQNYVKGFKNWPLNTMPMKQIWLDK